VSVVEMYSDVADIKVALLNAKYPPPGFAELYEFKNLNLADSPPT
jgi:hypothetical protein